jgi:hypothetical protein
VLLIECCFVFSFNGGYQTIGLLKSLGNTNDISRLLIGNNLELLWETKHVHRSSSNFDHIKAGQGLPVRFQHRLVVLTVHRALYPSKMAQHMSSILVRIPRVWSAFIPSVAVESTCRAWYLINNQLFGCGSGSVCSQTFVTKASIGSSKRTVGN